MEIKVPLLAQAVGLGDLIKAATSAVGIKPCGGCRKRAEALNAAVRLVPRVYGELWGASVPDGWDARGSCDRAAMFTRQGRWIAWETSGGRYQTPHSFCCGAVAEAAAREKFEALCR